MGLQIIFCVEAKRSSKSDYVYIKATVEHLYTIDRANTRLSPIYMDGKGNYCTKKVLREIQTHVKQYQTASKSNQSVVVYCFDCDDYDSKPEDRKFLESAKQYCGDNGYRFVWFCKDIENVYLGRSIPDNRKVKEAGIFAAKGMIRSIDSKVLEVREIRKGSSNLCLVLDDYLERRPSADKKGMPWRILP